MIAVRIWGDVPLILLPQSANSENFSPERAPQQEVYGQILTDLTEAENAGLPWTDESGRVSEAAVKTLLAKVYLTMAGQPLNETARYADAAAKAKEVIDNAGPIALFETYGQLHDESLNNMGEHIFRIQYNDLVVDNPMNDMYPNFQPVTYRGPSGTGSTIPDIDFYNSYDDFVGHVNLNSNQPLQEKHLLFPLPEQEIINSPNLTQNPGY